ncbi:MAG TPA: di-heme oxidoredictase family protein, partial [Thermoanaerobaculia bacterium]|nr:di-heme oxidoredictase family protein [Thermoanaerobaculia bacterium]
MRRLITALLCVLVTVSIQAQRRRSVGGGAPAAQTAAPGEPFAGLTDAQRNAFQDGRREFVEVETVTGGLGPVFNERSCVACHTAPAAGGTSPRMVTRFARRDGATFDSLVNLGGSLLQDNAIGPREGSPHAFRRENVPATANLVVRRRTTPLFGLGLVDATPDATFIALAQTQAARGDGVAGRVHLVDNIRAGMQTVGKFGWKAQVPSLFQFSGDAYLNEMGI